MAAEKGQIYRPTIRRAAIAIAKADGCVYGACSREVCEHYDAMALAALRSNTRGKTPMFWTMEEELQRSRQQRTSMVVSPILDAAPADAVVLYLAREDS